MYQLRIQADVEVIEMVCEYEAFLLLMISAWQMSWHLCTALRDTFSFVYRVVPEGHISQAQKSYLDLVWKAREILSSKAWHVCGSFIPSSLFTPHLISCASKIDSTVILFIFYLYDLYTCEPRHDKTNKMAVRPVKTQISLGIRPVWSEASLCAQWVVKDASCRHANSKDSDQTGWMPRLIWVFAGRTAILLVLSCRGSCIIAIVLSLWIFNHKSVKAVLGQTLQWPWGQQALNSTPDQCNLCSWLIILVTMTDIDIWAMS